MTAARNQPLRWALWGSCGYTRNSCVLCLLSLQRPLHMLAHERGRMVETLRQCGDDSLIRRRVAQRYGQVAQPAGVPDAAYRRAFGAAQEVVFFPCKQSEQPGMIKCVTRGEIRLTGVRRKLVPGAAQLAVVAAE